MEYVHIAWFGEPFLTQTAGHVWEDHLPDYPRGKGAGVLQIIRYDILITITAVKKMRGEELSQRILQKELSNTVSYTGKSKQERTTQCSKNPNLS